MEEVLSELKELRKELSKSRSETFGYRKKISEQLKSAKADKYDRSRRRSKEDDANSGGMVAADRTRGAQDRHLICMTHARVRFRKAAEYGGDPFA